MNVTLAVAPVARVDPRGLHVKGALGHLAGMDRRWGPGCNFPPKTGRAAELGCLSSRLPKLVGY